MKLSEFEKLTYSDLEKLSTEQLKKLASEQGQKLNKRLDRIASSKETNKSAVRAVKESGGRFGVGGLTVKSSNGKVAVFASRQNYIKEIRRQQNFQRSKTSTVRGAKKVQEESGKTKTGQTAKEYGRKKGNDYKKLTKRIKEKAQGHKLTKAQKKAIEKQAKRVEQEARKEYEKRISDYWKVYHEFKEKHPAQLEIGSMSTYYAPGVKALATKIASEEIESTKADVEKELEGILKRVKKDDATADVWETVEKDNPFDSKETPEQFTLRNGRIV